MKTLKPSLPYGQLPVLEWGGATVSQSMAIARFLAHECGLAGASTLEDALIDETVDVINDFQNALVRFLILKHHTNTNISSIIFSIKLTLKETRQ